MEPPRPSRESLAVFVGLLVLACVVYGASVTGEFLNWDDPRYVVHNAELQKPLPEAVGTIFSTFHFTNYNPLQRLSFLIDFKLFGASPMAFRVTNLLLHVLCGWLLFAVLRRWLGRSAPALLAAAVFVAHPANVENAAWISERKTLLATALAFAATLAWLRAGGGLQRGRAAAFALFALGLLAKTSIVVLPGLWLLLDLSQRRRPAWRWYAALAVPACVMAAVQVMATGSEGGIRSLHGGTWLTHTATAIAALPAHFWSLVQPFGLTPRHEFAPVESLVDPRLAAGLVLLAVAVWGARRSWRAERRFAVAAGWFGLVLLPTLVVPIPIIWSERYLYLAMPFLLAVAADGLLAMRAPAATPVRAAAAAWALLLAIVCTGYAHTWRTSVGLWTHALELNDRDHEAWVSLADARLARGDVQGAENAYLSALDVAPDFQPARENLAVLCLRRSELDRAATLLREVLDAAPERASAWATFGALLDLQNDELGASQAFMEGLGRSPDDVGLWHNVAQFHRRHGRRLEAEAADRELRRLGQEVAPEPAAPAR